MTVILYSKPQCVQCTATEQALKKKGIVYQTVDLTKDSQALEKVSLMGYRQAPVVCAGELHWSGFRPDMIERL